MPYARNGWILADYDAFSSLEFVLRFFLKIKDMYKRLYYQFPVLVFLRPILTSPKVIFIKILHCSTSTPSPLCVRFSQNSQIQKCLEGDLSVIDLGKQV